MTPLRVIAFCALYLVFTACSGGGGGSETPPHMNLVSPAGQQSIREGVEKLKSIKNGTCDSYGNLFVALQFVRGSEDLAKVMPFLLSTQDSDCDDNLKNAIWLFSHARMNDGTSFMNHPNSPPWAVSIIGYYITELSRRHGGTDCQVP